MTISTHHGYIVRPRPSPDPPPVNPVDLGLPEKFGAWRDMQWDVVQRILDSGKRFTIVCSPTGSGKSLCYMAASILSGRTVVLTATLGLQDQISADFGDGLSSDIRGLNNYLCPIAGKLGIPVTTTVADAPCQCGYGCALKKVGGCEYYDRYRIAQQADVIVTNYQLWMHDGVPKDSSDRGTIQYGPPIMAAAGHESEKESERQKVKMLVADEAHDAHSQISLFLGVDLSRRECLAMRLDWPDAGMTVDDWRQWAIGWKPKVAGRVTGAEQMLKAGHGGNSNGNGSQSWSKELKHLRDLSRKLDRLSGMQADDGWIVNEVDVTNKAMVGVRFDPLNPARYAEQVLWRGVDKIVLVSATVRPKTAELLGISSEDMEFIEYDSTFDPKRRPTIFVPTGVRMTYKTEQDDQAMRWWLRKLDEVIEPRLRYKGLIHAVSYKRAKFIKDNSEHGAHMLIHNSYDRARTVEQFKRSQAPCILVSPSVSTGYDFPGNLCRWQLIIKLPFASTKDNLIKARQEQDKEYGIYLTAQELVQSVGRAVRCFDLETEILTTNGWKKHNEVQEGDTAYGISSMDGVRQVIRGAVTVKENTIRAVKINANPEPVMEMYCPKGFDIVVTPDHSMVVQVRTTRNCRLMSTRGLVKIPAKDLPERFKIINAGRLRRKNQSIRRNLPNSCSKSMDWFRLMGIIISDGYISSTKSEIVICQSKPHTQPWIQSLIDRLGLKHRVHVRNASGTPMSVGDGPTYKRNYDQTTWVFAGTDAARIRDVFHAGRTRRLSVNKQFRKRRHKGTHGYAWVDGWKDVEKTIPRWVLQRASTSQMRALLEGLMVGDGTIRKGGGTYFTSSLEIADHLQELLVLSGYKSTLKLRSGRQQYEIGYCTKGFTDGVRKINVRPDVGRLERTWCVNTDLGTVIARRGGKTFIVGNSETDWAESLIMDDNFSWFYGRAKRYLPRWFQEAMVWWEGPGVPEPLQFDGVEK